MFRVTRQIPAKIFLKFLATSLKKVRLPATNDLRCSKEDSRLLWC